MWHDSDDANSRKKKDDSGDACDLYPPTINVISTRRRV
jgi:hypothetical protein